MNKRTTFYIVRHGQTDWNKNYTIQGHIDIPLNEVGIEQANATAKELRDIHFDLAFSSDLLRAKRTTDIIALEHKLAVQTTSRLREKMLGKFQGKPVALFHTHMELVKALIKAKRMKYNADNEIESDETVVSRVITFLRETAIAHPGKTILVGTHSGIFHLLLVHWGVLTYEQSDSMRIENGGYFILDTDGVDFAIQKMVGVEHRKQEDI